VNGVAHELFGRGGRVDRAAADHPWPFGILAGLVVAALAAALDAALGGHVDWLVVALLATATTGIYVAKGYQRRRDLTPGDR
jgi:hypothetical protein